jgi:hypothetical protein
MINYQMLIGETSSMIPTPDPVYRLPLTIQFLYQSAEAGTKVETVPLVGNCTVVRDRKSIWT